MEEQVTWKGQSFTLLVFGGIVFLCSIFFVLGMLVGRGQGKSTAEPSKLTDSAKSSEEDSPPQDEKTTKSTYETITVGKDANRESKLSESKDPEQAQSKPSSPDKPPSSDKPAKAPPKPAGKTSSTASTTSAPPKTAAPKPAASTPAKMIYLQVYAVASDSAAKKQATELEKAGFRAVIMGGGGANALYKVQVGPFATTTDADTAKKKLESMGYMPIRK